MPVWVKNSLEIRVNEGVFSISVCQLGECSNSVLLLIKTLREICGEE